MKRLFRSGLWVGFAASMEMLLVLELVNGLVWSKVVIAGTVTTLAYRYIQNTFRNDIIDKSLLTIGCICVPFLEIEMLLWWIPLWGIVVLYKNAYPGVNLRKVGAIKSLVVSICWLLFICSCLTFSQINNERTFLILFSEFSMFLSLTAANDLFLDDGEKSPWKSTSMIQTWRVFFALLSSVFFFLIEPTFQIPVFLVALIPFAFIWPLRSKYYPREAYAFLWVDGCIILRGVMVFFFVA
jgi:hypothetical protein